MRILLTHRYYTPDTPPYAAMLHMIAKALVSAGHDVQVYTTKPSYKTAEGVFAPAREVLDGVGVRRMSVFSENRASVLRAFNALWYCLRLFVHVIRRRPDVLQAATFPPVIAGWTASLAAKLVGARFVYHMQDVHPEVSVQAGGAMGRGLLRKIGTWMDNAALRRAAAIVVLSDDMRNTVLSRSFDHNSKIHVINNFLPIDPDTSEPVPQVDPLSNAELSLIFAGNIGTFQGLEAVIDAAHATSDLPDLHYWFLGDGAAKKGLLEQAGDLVGKTVFFAPFCPAAEAAALIRTSDLALASLAPGIFRVSYPSKVLTYLALGTPIFACVESESELARTIEREKIGFSAPPKASAAIAASMRAAWDLRSTLPEYGRRAESLYNERFSLARATDTWSSLYESLRTRST